MYKLLSMIQSQNDERFEVVLQLKRMVNCYSKTFCLKTELQYWSRKDIRYVTYLYIPNMICVNISNKLPDASSSWSLCVSSRMTKIKRSCSIKVISPFQFVANNSSCSCKPAKINSSRRFSEYYDKLLFGLFYLGFTILKHSKHTIWLFIIW